MTMLVKQEKRIRRHKRVRAKAKGTSMVPRFCVFRSNKYIYVQLIDDETGKTLLATSSQELKSSKLKTQSSKPSPLQRDAAIARQLEAKNFKNKKEKIIRTMKVAVAYEVGKLIAQKALKKKIKKVVFDRSGYRYHGRVKALAEGAREGGLIF